MKKSLKWIVIVSIIAVFFGRRVNSFAIAG